MSISAKAKQLYQQNEQTDHVQHASTANGTPPAGNNGGSAHHQPPLSRRVTGILIMAACVVTITLLCWILVRPMLSLARDPAALRAYIQERGIGGVLLFMFCVVLQVFAAIIPGGPFEIAAGYAFGVLPGSIICDIAMTFGSVMVFLLTRKFGMKFVELFFSREKIESVKFLHTNDKMDLVLFLVFLVPGTPKDIISYLVGLTDLSLGKWLFIVAVGRFPCIVLSALSGSALGAERYEIFLLLLLVTGGLTLLGTWIYHKKNHE